MPGPAAQSVLGTLVAVGGEEGIREGLMAESPPCFSRPQPCSPYLGPG